MSEQISPACYAKHYSQKYAKQALSFKANILIYTVIIEVLIPSKQFPCFSKCNMLLAILWRSK